jgi:hypothetical protein
VLKARLLVPVRCSTHSNVRVVRLVFRVSVSPTTIISNLYTKPSFCVRQAVQACWSTHVTFAELSRGLKDLALDAMPSNVSSAAAPQPQIDPLTGEDIQWSPVLAGVPEVDNSDDVRVGEAPPEIPEDVEFTRAGTTGQATAPESAPSTARSVHLFSCTSITLLAVVLLGTLGR